MSKSSIILLMNRRHRNMFYIEAINCVKRIYVSRDFGILM
jgi:hypothetical protein